MLESEESAFASKMPSSEELALLLLQALTLERDPDLVLHPAPNGESLLPPPFREIIYQGASGRWTLAPLAASASQRSPEKTSRKSW